MGEEAVAEGGLVAAGPSSTWEAPEKLPIACLEFESCLQGFSTSGGWEEMKAHLRGAISDKPED